MRNWIIVLLIFIMPLGVYAFLDMKSQNATQCKVVGNSQALPKAKIIKFSSPMCSECQEVAVEIKKAMKGYQDSVIVEEINVLENNEAGNNPTKEAIKKYKISLVPTLIFINKDGKIFKKQEGLMKSDEIIAVLDMIK